MKSQPGITALIAAAALSWMSAPLNAQGPARAAELSVLRLNDLSFGQVVAGIPVHVHPTQGNALQFEIQGPRGRLVTLTFTLPEALESGFATAPIVFGPSSAAWSDRATAQGATLFDPAIGTQAVFPGSRRIFVWLGGTLAPPARQPAGGYAGVVTLSAVLN